MANISDLSGDEREQRIAELKKKMQEAAAQRATEQAAEPQAPEAEAEVAAKAAPAAAVAVAEADEAAAEADEVVAEASDAVESGAVEEVVADEAATEEVAAEVVTEAEPVLAAPTNGANGASAAEPLFYEKTEEEKLKSEMNRREFITYAWGAAMGLLSVQALGVTYLFMYPRFREGEFGGVFRMGPESSAPPNDGAPIGVSDGKFWWLSVENEGPKAIYMVCTHLGCLYKWVGDRNRFECPCHGSKFTREGYYIEGPAPRSLDEFETALVDGEWVVDTGAKITGGPAADSPARGEV